VRPSLLLRIASLEARTRMSYRVDFWLSTVVGFAAQLALAYFLWQAIFATQAREVIGGFHFEGMVVYYVAVLLVGKLTRGREFEGAVSDDIYQGGLNRYIVFPVPYLPFKYAQHIGAMLPSVVQFVLFGVVTLLLLDLAPELRPTAGRLAMALGAAALANLLHFLMSFPVQAVAFWADNVWSLEVARRLIVSFLGGYMLPLSVFPDWALPVLEVLPFRFLFDFPVRALLGQLTVGSWALGLLVTAGWCGVFAVIARIVWKRGSLQYTGIGI
jgi:ABC-2 type transport system permease protein